ncbi:MAG: 50S ribosome-binding GTPase, partial [Candidatus Helarchaeota archaeon]|nr:50S ribosome-binding GTPase [Candidatus Helarchaeota archaeon]
MEYEIVDTIVQQRVKKFSNFLIGKGKVEELQEMIQTYKIDTVIFYNVLTSKQHYNLTTEFKCEVKDRYDLILDIFERQSTDIVSKLQISLAVLSKTFPKIKIAAHLQKSRTEHAFLGSSGEYAYHSKIRAYDKQMAKIQSELEVLKERKLDEIASRKRGQYPNKIICIGGYYNAGKTTLFNALTGADKPVSNRPFTTLSSKYQHIKNPQSKLILVDTIGFVYDIDLALIKSFELQILDMQNADKLLYLIGLDDPVDNIITKFQYGLELFQDIGVDIRKIIAVFNKIDLISKEAIEKLLETLEPTLKEIPNIFVSAKKSQNLDALIKLF